MRIVVPANRLFVRITTPGILPGAADPNFAMTYDLTLRTALTLPDSLAGSVVQGPVVAAASNVSPPQTNSITGNLALAANDVVAFLGGSNFVGALRRGGAARIPGIDAGAAALNSRLAGFRASAPPGTRLDNYQQDNLVIVLATRRPPPAGPR